MLYLSTFLRRWSRTSRIYSRGIDSHLLSELFTNNIDVQYCRSSLLVKTVWMHSASLHKTVHKRLIVVFNVYYCTFWIMGLIYNGVIFIWVTSDDYMILLFILLNAMLNFDSDEDESMQIVSNIDWPFLIVSEKLHALFFFTIQHSLHLSSLV